MPLRTSDIGSGLVSHANKSSKNSNDKAFDSLFYESYDGGTSNQSAKAIQTAQTGPVQKQKEIDEPVTIEELQKWNDAVKKHEITAE